MYQAYFVKKNFKKYLIEDSFNYIFIILSDFSLILINYESNSRVVVKWSILLRDILYLNSFVWLSGLP